MVQSILVYRSSRSKPIRPLRSILLALSLAFINTALPAQTDADMRDLVRGCSTFAFDLYHQLGAKEGNLFFSPYSISSALAMTYAGARGNTETEMSATLHFSLGQGDLHPAFGALATHLNALQDSGHVQLAIANSLWPQQGPAIKEDYLALVRRFYADTVTFVDYRLRHGEAARETINTWVAAKTQNKIVNLIPPGGVDDSSRITVVNAIYFNGKWKNEFNKKSTKDAPFYTGSQGEVKVPLMYQQERFSYAQFDDFQMLEVPYVGDELSMIVFLPAKDTPLSALESKLSSSEVGTWRSRLQKQTVKVFLPKFTATDQFSLATMLIKMGMVHAFDPWRADFSGMVRERNLFCITNVIHKAFVDVSEEGTEAAAATAVVMGMTNAYHPPEVIPVFRADHPFIFLIQEKKTGSILFLGRLVNPKQ